MRTAGSVLAAFLIATPAAGQQRDSRLTPMGSADPIKLLNANSYPKGAWVLHMLRGLMGDSAFFRDLPFEPAEVRVDPDGKLLLRVTAIGRR